MIAIIKSTTKWLRNSHHHLVCVLQRWKCDAYNSANWDCHCACANKYCSWLLWWLSTSTAANNVWPHLQYSQQQHILVTHCTSRLMYICTCNSRNGRRWVALFCAELFSRQNGRRFNFQHLQGVFFYYYYYYFASAEVLAVYFAWLFFFCRCSIH